MEEGVPRTAACKRVGIDTRTYYRYADQLIDWESEEH
jgi:ACT domain-containing protein